MVGIDVPLGWPDAFVEAVTAHHDGSGWPPAAIEPPLDRRQLRFRATDLASWEAGSRPLSVSSDLIGVPAMRGARLQHLLRLRGIPVDRSGTSGRVAEVYPAAALRHWGLPASGYKGPKHASACAELTTALTSACASLADAATACLAGCDDDALDAFVCALLARAVQLGQTTYPPDDVLPVARREGWIHLPTEPLATLFSVAAASADPTTS